MDGFDICEGIRQCKITIKNGDLKSFINTNNVLVLCDDDIERYQMDVPFFIQDGEVYQIHNNCCDRYTEKLINCDADTFCVLSHRTGKDKNKVWG